MGCGDSKGLTAQETTINNKNAKQNSSKNDESKVKLKNATKNNIILTENNTTKDDINKDIGNNEYKDKINLIYYADYQAVYPIFGENFVKNNKDNIDLIINGKQNELVNKYLLTKGENIITLVIKNKLTDLSHMFYGIKFVKNFSELKYLDVSQTEKFSEMFSGCMQLTDINFISNWKVTNSKFFCKMFYFCQSLIDIKALENWDVSNCENFFCMFYKCSSLSDIKPLHNWNVSNG